MDNKQSLPTGKQSLPTNNPQQTGQQAGPGVPLQPTIDPPGTVTDQPKGGSGKGIWVIVSVVVLILAIGGVYWYKNSSQKTSGASSSTTNVAQNANTSQSVDSLDKDLNSTSLDDLDKQFTQVDTDLGSL